MIFALAAPILIGACSASKKSVRTEILPAFNAEGHRGTRGVMPENTISSMYRAIDFGVNTVEVDVVFSKDKQVVISHDFYFHHDITTTPEGKTLTAKEAQKLLIYQMNYDSVKKYDVGLKPHPDFPQQQKVAAYKPLLGELIDSTLIYASAKKRKVLFNIELKVHAANDGTRHPDMPEYVDRVMEVVNAKNLSRGCYLQSFDFRPLQYLHKKYPAILTAILISGSDKRSFEQQLTELGYQPEMYSPHFSVVNEALVDACHKRGIKIIPWTVNTVEDMRKMKALGVDGIITDYPNFFSQL
ncbi:MAG: glycerophosphodiester phosphodiesterase [Gemmatimonadaceae bacterium]|nr:glycerophosphodiester phosphodiesterase [Chitinophagaceae bacterium]